MPFSFRVEGTIDDPTIQSLYYGPILLAAQADPVGEDLESGLLDVSFYRNMKLDGDLASALTPTAVPLHFTTRGLTMAPFYIADPAPPQPEDEEVTENGRGRRGPPTQPYHMYFRRAEPEIVFGSVNSGVPNPVGPEDRTFLDDLWDAAPFSTHQEFLATVERITGDWVSAGRFSENQQSAILQAARGRDGFGAEGCERTGQDRHAIGEDARSTERLVRTIRSRGLPT